MKEAQEIEKRRTSDVFQTNLTDHRTWNKNMDRRTSLRYETRMIMVYHSGEMGHGVVAVTYTTTQE